MDDFAQHDEDDPLTQHNTNVDEDPYARLKRAFVNERACPEILQYEESLVDEAVEHVDMQQAELDDRRASAATAEAGRDSSASDDLVDLLKTMELDRVKYLLRAYLRTRLYKLETFSLHIMQDSNLFSRLSQRERRFLGSHTDLLDKLHDDLVLKHLPQQFNSLVQQDTLVGETNDMVPSPNLDTHVFIRVRGDLGRVNVGYSESEPNGRPSEVDMSAGDQFVVRYRPIAQLLANGEVELL